MKSGIYKRKLLQEKDIMQSPPPLHTSYVTLSVPQFFIRKMGITEC